jgi:excisionase family DNA binding protein
MTEQRTVPGDVELLTHQVARRLKITVKGVQALLHDGRLPGRKLGNEKGDPWLVMRSDVDAYIERVTWKYREGLPRGQRPPGRKPAVVLDTDR